MVASGTRFTSFVACLACIVGISTSTCLAGSLKWNSNYSEARKVALQESKPMLIMFTATWCGPCQKMKSSTLSDAKVEKYIADNFVPVMIDTDKDSATSRKFGVSAMPTIAIVDPKTETSEKTRGYQGSSQFLSFLSTNKPEIQVASQTEKPGKAQVGHADLVQQADKGEFTPYCLVTAVNEGKLVEGKKEFTSEHDGYTLHFASAETKKEFDSKPEDFWPALNGNCPVHLVETGELVRGEVRWVVEFRNKLYMCHSREHANKFIDSPSRYAAAAQDRVSSAR